MPHVQFSDDTQSKIVSYFCGPQDPNFWPNCEEIPTWDIRWKVFYEAHPDRMRSTLPEPTERWEG